MLRQESASENLLYEQVADHVIKLIDGGTLHAGERLPSIRKLSSQMAVSVSTVLQAYMISKIKTGSKPNRNRDIM